MGEAVKPVTKALQVIRLGDKVEAVIKATKLDKLAPKDCGCAKRKALLNGEKPDA